MSWVNLLVARMRGKGHGSRRIGATGATSDQTAKVNAWQSDAR